MTSHDLTYMNTHNIVFHALTNSTHVRSTIYCVNGDVLWKWDVSKTIPDSKVHGAKMGPTRGRRLAPRWPHESCSLECLGITDPESSILLSGLCRLAIYWTQVRTMILTFKVKYSLRFNRLSLIRLFLKLVLMKRENLTWMHRTFNEN